MATLAWSLFFFLIYFSRGNSQIQHPLTQWTTITSPPMPYGKSLLFTGYESSTEKIWLIGGDYQIWSYNLKSKNFSHSIYGDLNVQLGTVNSQCSVQWGSSIYFVNEGILREFSFETAQLTSFNSPLPYNREAPCVSAMYPDYIFATGGIDIDAVDRNESAQLQIFPANSSGAWYAGPEMNNARSNHACIVYNNYLYAFGGMWLFDVYYSSYYGRWVYEWHARESSERIYIGDMANIASYNWSYIDYIPGSNVYYHRAVVDSLYDQIYLIGGRDTVNGAASRGIQIYDISTSTMTLINTGSGILNIGRSSPAVILVNNHIYVFGGSNTDSYEISNLLTLSPTISPTKSPTNATTDQPTQVHTKSPTKSESKPPSKSPIKYPSKSPTKSPTNTTFKQTYNPTMEPSFRHHSDGEVSDNDLFSTDTPTTDHQTNSKWIKYPLFVGIALIVFLFILCCFICRLIVYLRRLYKRYKINKTKTAQHIEVEMQRKLDSVSITDCTPYFVTLSDDQEKETNAYGPVSDDDDNKRCNNISRAKSVSQAEGVVKVTKRASAVKLEIIEDKNITDDGNGDRNDKKEDELLGIEEEENKVGVHDEGDMKELQNVNKVDGDDNKADALLDDMLSDILQMQDLDPNKIHQINVNNKNVDSNSDSDSDSDDSDNMYEKSENDDSVLSDSVI